MTSILKKPKGSAGGPRADQSSSDSAEDKRKPTSLKVDISASDSSQGSGTRRRRLASKGQPKKRPMSRQPPTKSSAIYSEVQKEQVFKGKTSFQPDPYQSGGDGGSQRKLSRDKRQSRPVQLIPRGRVTTGGSASSRDFTKLGGSRQSSADSATNSKDKARPSTESPRSSSRQEPSANQRRAGETRHELLSRSRQEQEAGSAEQGRSQAWRDADSRATGTARHGENNQYPRSARGEGAQSRNQSFKLPEGNGEDWSGEGDRAEWRAKEIERVLQP